MPAFISSLGTYGSSVDAVGSSAGSSTGSSVDGREDSSSGAVGEGDCAIVSYLITSLMSKNQCYIGPESWINESWSSIRLYCKFNMNRVTYWSLKLAIPISF